MMTTSQLAKRLGVTPRRVRELVRTGIVPGRRVGPWWIIDDDRLAVTAGEARKTKPGPAPRE